MLQAVETSLREKDESRQRLEGIKCFWGIDSISTFTQLARTHTDNILTHGQITADFTTMYTAFTFDAIISRTIAAASEAWSHWETHHRPLDAAADQPLTLGINGWDWNNGGWPLDDLKTLLEFAIHNAFVYNGGVLLHQKQGMVMGLGPAPQIANLACYPVERDHALALRRQPCWPVCR